MPGLMTPKGGDTKQTTNVVQQPSYVQDIQQFLYGAGKNMLGGLVGSQPDYTTAGINADQSGAYDLIRSLAQGSFTNKGAAVPANTNYAPRIAGDAAVYGATATGPAAEYNPRIAGDAAVYGATSAGDARTYAGTGTNGPALINGASIQALMDPYTQSVIDPALANMRRQSDISSAQIGAQSAASGSFGGSREALRQGQNTRALGEQTAQLVPQLLSQSYGQAAQLAGQNAQMRNADAQFNAGVRNTADQFNASAGNAMAQFNAGATNQANAANAAATNAMAQFNAGAINRSAQDNQAARNQFALTNANATNAANAANAAATNNMAQFNAGAINQAAQFGVQQGMNAAQIADALASSDQTRKMQAIQMLLGIGNQQRDITQANLSTPLEYLKLLAALTPQQTGSTTVTNSPNTAASPLQTLIGGAGSLLTAPLGGGTTLLGKLFG